MKNYSRYTLVFLIGLLLSISGCQKDDYELGEITMPNGVELTYEIVGMDTDNPYGDGSGEVNFTATASNAITFNYEFGDGKDNEVAPDGKVKHRFTKTGVNEYYVTVSAIGTGGLSASKTLPVEVYSSFTDDEAVEYLTGGTSKKWYWAADQTGHVGLGPNFVDGTNHTFAAWYNAGPFEKTCMYDAEFEFTKTADGMTFEQTAGPSFVPGTYAGTLGVDPDDCYGADVIDPYGVKNVSLSPAESIATVDGNYRGTSMSFSDGGYMCWYVGVSTYEIIEVSENLLKVRIEESGTFAWYHTFTTTKPVQSK